MGHTWTQLTLAFRQLLGWGNSPGREDGPLSVVGYSSRGVEAGGHSQAAAMGKVWSEEGKDSRSVGWGHRKEARPLLRLAMAPPQFRAKFSRQPPRRTTVSYRVLLPQPITSV